jgi:hypothetical protein
MRCPKVLVGAQGIAPLFHFHQMFNSVVCNLKITLTAGEYLNTARDSLEINEAAGELIGGRV